MSSEAEFQAALVLGNAAEEIVYSYLKTHNSYVQDLRKQSHEDKKGPRLSGTEGELVLPDFAVYNKDPRKGNFAIDVKYKKSIYPAKGKKCFTVDSKYEDYKRVTSILKLDFLMIAFVHQNKMYFYKDTDCFDTTTFANQYGSGNVYLFEFDSKKHIY
jgi:hypothetical protein